MNKLLQFREQLNTILDGNESKDKFLGAFDEAYNDNEGIKTDLVSQRDDLKAKNKDINAMIDVTKSTLGLEEITAENIGAILSDKQTDATKMREELTLKYDEKYSNDFNTLKEQIAGLESQNGEITTKYNDNLFSNGVKNTEAFQNMFVDDMEAQNSIILPKLRDKLLFKDGQVFMKDATTGDIAYELGTNKPLSPESAIKEVASGLSPIYLKAQSNADGMGTTTTQQQSGGDTKVDASKHNNVNSFINEAMSNLNK